jgi:hypothetical protein
LFNKVTVSDVFSPIRGKGKTIDERDVRDGERGGKTWHYSFLSSSHPSSSFGEQQYVWRDREEDRDIRRMEYVTLVTSFAPQRLMWRE